MAASLVLLTGCSGESSVQPEPTASPRADLMLGHEGFIGGDADGLSTFEFGLQIVETGYELSDLLVPEPAPLSGLGDQAFEYMTVSGGEVVEKQVVAQQGDRVVYVRNGLLQYGAERATEQDTLDVAQALLDLSDEQIDAIEPTTVSAPCPAVDRVSEILGDVALARGQEIAGSDILTCSYLSAAGVRLRTTRFTYDADAVTGDGDAIEIEDAETAEIRSSSSSIDATALLTGDISWRVGVTPVGEPAGALPAADAVVALLAAQVAMG